MFKERGIQSMLEDEINNHIPDMGKMGQMSVDITTSPLWVSGSFDTPIVNGALFHQSTFHDLLVKGLSLTIGLRLDYEKNSMTYSSRSDINYNFNMNSVMIKDPISQALSLAPAFNGKLDNDYLQLLPKFALQYEWKKGNSVYGTVSRGYRSGGYNVQMFSDLIKSSMRNGMQGQIKESLTEIFSHMQGMPPSVIDKILANIPGAGPEPDVAAATTFKPEYTWNYEVGAHLTLFDNRLFADMAAFYMDTRNQQVAKFAESGLGRVTVNAGKSRSYGAEIALRADITDDFSLNANYGYTYATFREYAVDKNTNYKGNYVPFVPKHTLNAGAQYIFRIAPRHWLDRVQLNANYNAAGRIYWTEANNASQSFYGTLNGRVSLEKGNGAIAFWIRNALDKKYEAFYFESMGNGFMQKGRPMQLGIEVRCRF